MSTASLPCLCHVRPRPVNRAGHTVAGGCMLALACDRRVMARGKGKISLNEIGFGSSVFAGSVEMLRFAVCSRNAQEILYSGALYDADQATLFLVGHGSAFGTSTQLPKALEGPLAKTGPRGCRRPAGELELPGVRCEKS